MTIASRCVRGRLRSRAARRRIVDALVAEGASSEVAPRPRRRRRRGPRTGAAAGDRSGPRGRAASSGTTCPTRLDGTGATGVRAGGGGGGHTWRRSWRRSSRAHEDEMARATAEVEEFGTRRARWASSMPARSARSGGSAWTSCVPGWPRWRAATATRSWRTRAVGPACTQRPGRRSEVLTDRLVFNVNERLAPVGAAAGSAPLSADETAFVGPTCGRLPSFVPARVAQSAEQLTRNEQVKGSIPFSGSEPKA